MKSRNAQGKSFILNLLPLTCICYALVYEFDFQLAVDLTHDGILVCDFATRTNFIALRWTGCTLSEIEGFHC